MHCMVQAAATMDATGGWVTKKNRELFNYIVIFMILHNFCFSVECQCVFLFKTDADTIVDGNLRFSSAFISMDLDIRYSL